MIATAVALGPARLVIAGMDLFQHPEGSYPGDTSTPNAYTLRHDRDAELDFLLHVLRRYSGELVILGAPLARAWGEFLELHPSSKSTRDNLKYETDRDARRLD